MWAHVKEDALSFMKQAQDELKDNFEKVIVGFCVNFDLFFNFLLKKYVASYILHPLFFFSYLLSLLSSKWVWDAESQKYEIKMKADKRHILLENLWNAWTISKKGK